MVSQPPAVGIPLSQLPTTGVHSSNTSPLPQSRGDAESMSSRATCTEMPSLVRASYPAYFVASSGNPNRAGVDVDNDHTQRRGSSTTTAPSLMDSLSTTSINHGQGVPLSSTHVQHCSQRECPTLAGNRHPQVKVHPPPSTTSASLQSDDECYSRDVHVPSIKHHTLTHMATDTGPEEQQHQARLSQGELEAVDQVSTSTTRTTPLLPMREQPDHEPATPPLPVRQRTKPVTSPLPVRQRWLSLPSATPEQQRSSPCVKMEREGTGGSVGGSCREIGTQTLYVESVATQTDLDRKERDNPPTSPGTIGRMNVSSSSPTLTKGSVDSTAMSVGELCATAPSHTQQANTNLSIMDGRPRPGQDISDSHGVPQDFNSDDVLLEELLTASFLLNGQGALVQMRSQGFNSTTKEAELLRLE